MRKPLFVDRDGVINVDVTPYVTDLSSFELFPYTIEALSLLHAEGYDLYVISNQQGVAKGLYDETLLHAIESFLQSELESKGARIRDFYYCTAAKSENHPWRKPAPGMIFAAQEEHHLNLEGACFIGDKWSDVECAVRAGLKPILVLSGVTRPDQWKNWAHQPVEVYENLLEAANALIL